MENHLLAVRDNYYVKAKVSEINIEKDNAKTAAEMLKVLTKQQNFYVNLNTKLKTKADENLLRSIGQANKNAKDHSLEQLHKIVNVHLSKNITEPEEVTKILKKTEGTHGIKETYKTLIDSYENHVIDQLYKGLKEIHDGHTIDVGGGKKFNCQIKFLEHVLEVHKHNEFLPRQSIVNARNELIQCKNDKDYEMTL